MKKISSLYVHIPFCEHICSYCDFCKMFYNTELCDKYLDVLLKELEDCNINSKLKTIYIGGGTPSCLNAYQLERFLFELNRCLDDEYEFSIEVNPENISEDKIKLLSKYGVNRVSIGVQTFNEKYLSFLNRKHTKEEIIKKINICKEIGFKNINIDLIYGLPNQTIDELNSDIDEFLKLDITHISTYSLIIEPNTKIYIENYKNIDEDLDYEMYNLICKKLKIFSKLQEKRPNTESKAST